MVRMPYLPVMSAFAGLLVSFSLQGAVPEPSSEKPKDEVTSPREVPKNASPKTKVEKKKEVPVDRREELLEEIRKLYPKIEETQEK